MENPQGKSFQFLTLTICSHDFFSCFGGTVYHVFNLKKLEHYLQLCIFFFSQQYIIMLIILRFLSQWLICVAAMLTSSWQETVLCVALKSWALQSAKPRSLHCTWPQSMHTWSICALSLSASNQRSSLWMLILWI